MTKEQLIAKIKDLAEAEKFKVDAYFMCGFPTEAPNDDLLKACEKYLEDVEKTESAENLIKELEKAAAKKVDIAEVDNLLGSEGSATEILKYKDMLLGA